VIQNWARVAWPTLTCLRGGSNQKREESMTPPSRTTRKQSTWGATADDWSCDPYNPLFGLYADSRRYDQSWDVVHKARTSGKWGRARIAGTD